MHAIYFILFACLTRKSTSFLVRNPHSSVVKRRVPENVSRNAPLSSKPISLQMTSPLHLVPTQVLAETVTSMSADQAEALAGPLFGASLFPYLAFLYFLNVKENDCPKGVTVGFATCLLFVFLTIPAAIVSKVWYGASLADSDWLHGSAEGVLTITNLVTVVAFRQALQAKQQQRFGEQIMPESATSFMPMIKLVVLLTALSSITILVPGLTGAQQHTPYLNGFMDLPTLDWTQFGAHAEPENALTIATWIIHVSSLVEFLVAMGFCWRWGDVVRNPTWKGLTWGLLPLHSSGITACTYHLFYNHIPILVPLQAFLTCVGNTTAAYAALQIALSNGWNVPDRISFLARNAVTHKDTIAETDKGLIDKESIEPGFPTLPQESPSLVGFEDLGEVLQSDNDYTFLFKLFAGCAIGSYLIKYGELFLDFPFESQSTVAFTVILVPSALNAFKWWKRSQDPTFEGWF